MQVPRLHQEEKNLNSKEIESVVKIFPTKESLGPDGFND